MDSFAVDETAPVLVEFVCQPGLQQVSLSPANIAEKSAEVVDGAINTIHIVARRIGAAVDALAVPPREVEVQFGLKLDAEAGALIAKAGMEAHMNVKLTWRTQ